MADFATPPVTLKLDPAGDVLNSFIERNNMAHDARVAGTAMSAAILGERHAG